jgi:Aromatic-ring-opening dioxygenase LigAB, LigA subunit
MIDDGPMARNRSQARVSMNGSRNSRGAGFVDGCVRSRPGQLDNHAHPGHGRGGVSLYQVQKLLFHVNRDVEVRARFLSDREGLLTGYELTAEERRALLATDFHALYQMGVHSLLLGPLAAALGVSFPDYLARLREAKR